MAGTSTTLEIILQAKDEATAKLKGISEQAQKIGATAGIMGGAIVGALGLAVKAAGDAQVAMAQVNQTVDNTLEQFSVKSLNALQKVADAANGEGADIFEYVKQKIGEAGDAAVKMGFDDEEAAQSVALLFQRTGDLTQAQKLNALAMDLSRAKNISLTDSTKLVSQVLAGNNKVLKQYGIELKEGATPLENLGELQKKVAGQAEAFTNTFEGQTQVLQATFGNLVEQIGSQLLPILTQILQKISPIIQQIIDWTNSHQELTKVIVMVVAGLGILLTAIGALGLVIGPLTAAFTFLAGTGGLVITAIAGIVAIIVELVAIYKILHDDGDLVILGLKAYWQDFVNFLKTKVLNPISDFFKAIWDDITGIVKSACDAIMGFFQPVLNAIDKIASGVASAYNTVKGGVSSAVKSVSNFISGKAGGGTVLANTPYLVGEDGPEIYTPSISGTITPNGGLGGGGSITINMNGGTYLSEGVAKDLGDLIIQQWKRQVRV